MIVYKFRVTFEDPDDVSRDIELKPGQTFGAFHNAILDSVNFDTTGKAIFYASDDYWRKGVKIPFEDFGKKKLVEFVEDPHQKFLYEYESKSKWPFTIELIKITDGETGHSYPRCVKSNGDAPMQYSPINPTLDLNEMNDEAGVTEEFDDSVFYRNPEEMETFSESGENSRSSAAMNMDEEELGDEGDENDFEEEPFDEEGNYDEDGY